MRKKMTSTIAQLFLSYKDRVLIFQTSQQEKMSLPGYNNPSLIQEYVLKSKIGIFTLVQNVFQNNNVGTGEKVLLVFTYHLCDQT